MGDKQKAKAAAKDDSATCPCCTYTPPIPISVPSTSGPNAALSFVVYLNGSTDYIELYAIGSSAWTRSSTSVGNGFQASLIRSA